MIRNWATGFIAIIAVLAGAAVTASAATLDIQLTGLDLKYDGTDLYDAASKLGGLGNTADADGLVGIDFLVDGVLAGSLTSDIFADMFVKGVTGLPVGGGFVTSSGNGDSFGLDLLSGTGPLLSLNLDKVSIFYTGGKIAIGGGAKASSLVFQNLPFSLNLDPIQDINIAFSSAVLGNVTDNDLILTGFDASGTANITGVVPEPSSIALVGMALAGLCVARRRIV